jgi:hypothetical protein
MSDERDGCVDAEDMALERKPRRRKWRWSFVDNQLRDRNRVDTEQARTVLQGLHLPSLDAAGKCRRVAEVAGVRWGGDASNDDRDSDDNKGGGDSAHVQESLRWISTRRSRMLAVCSTASASVA